MCGLTGILSENKISEDLILKNAEIIEITKKNSQFGEFLKNWKLQSNSVTRQVKFQ